MSFEGPLRVPVPEKRDEESVAEPVLDISAIEMTSEHLAKRTEALPKRTSQEEFEDIPYDSDVELLGSPSSDLKEIVSRLYKED